METGGLRFGTILEPVQVPAAILPTWLCARNARGKPTGAVPMLPPVRFPCLSRIQRANSSAPGSPCAFPLVVPELPMDGTRPRAGGILGSPGTDMGVI